MMKRWFLGGLFVGTLVLVGMLWHAVTTTSSRVTTKTQAERWLPENPIRSATIRGETVMVPAVRGAPPRKLPPSRPGLPATTRLLPGQHDGLASPLPGT